MLNDLRGSATASNSILLLNFMLATVTSFRLSKSDPPLFVCRQNPRKKSGSQVLIQAQFLETQISEIWISLRHLGNRLPVHTNRSFFRSFSSYLTSSMPGGVHVASLTRVRPAVGFSSAPPFSRLSLRCCDRVKKICIMHGDVFWVYVDP